jgi:hypothetical protein
MPLKMLMILWLQLDDRSPLYSLLNNPAAFRTIQNVMIPLPSTGLLPLLGIVRRGGVIWIGGGRECRN